MASVADDLDSETLMIIAPARTIAINFDIYTRYEIG
jgi:hypothetical protein